MYRQFSSKVLSMVFLCAVATVSSVGLSAGLDWFHKRGEHKGWRYIVIHHSATAAGSAKAFDRYHSNQGFGGLAYHFVIGNGSGSADGVVETGFRWKEQITGTHVSVNSWHYNIFGIGICLVGNFELSQPTSKQWSALVKLVARLAKDNAIPVDRIIGHQHVSFDHSPSKKEQTSCPGSMFPLDRLREAVAAQLAVEKDA